MPDCTQFEEWIGAAVDGELTEEEQGALSAHLSECESCRAFYEALRSVSASIREDVPAPPPELKDRIMAEVRASAPAKGRVTRFPRYARAAALAAAAALVLWSGVRLSHMGMGSAAPASAPANEMMSLETAEEAPAEEAPAEVSRTLVTEPAAGSIEKSFAADAKAEGPAHLVLTGEEDLAGLRDLTGLESIDATACRDYEGLLALQRALPECRIEWLVDLGGQSVSSLEETIAPASAEGLMEALPYLPRVRTVDLRGCSVPAETLEALENAFPAIEFLS